jgi:hypothetical protein
MQQKGKKNTHLQLLHASPYSKVDQIYGPLSSTKIHSCEHDYAGYKTNRGNEAVVKVVRVLKN